jgi:chromosome segregation ATPase
MATLENSEAEVTATPVAILDDTELISHVIGKHEKFIQEYSDELKGLEDKLNNNHTEFQRIKKELETLETRIVVLTEKRHQLYHQAKKLRVQLFEAIVNREQTQHLENELQQIENRLQNSNMSSIDEYGYIDRLNSLLKENVSPLLEDNASSQMTMSSIIDILEMAKTARKELDDVESSPTSYKNESNLVKKEFEEKEARVEWLNRRMKLHKEAMKYWEKMKTGDDHPE